MPMARRRVCDDVCERLMARKFVFASKKNNGSKSVDDAKQLAE
jgi:hypothetical protein